MEGFTPVCRMELRFQTMAGGWKWVHVTGKVFERDTDGKALRIVGTTQEISGRKTAEDERWESERKYKELAELLPQHVFEVDKRGVFTFSNRAGLALLGYGSEEDEAPRIMNEVLAPEDRSRALEDLERLRRGEKLKGVEYRLLKQDGTTVPVVSFIVPVMECDDFSGARGCGGRCLGTQADAGSPQQSQERTGATSSGAHVQAGRSQ